MPIIVDGQPPSQATPFPWFPHGIDITVITRTESGRDREGNPTFTESEQVYVGAFDPAIGFESTTLQDQVSTQPQAYLPSSAAVTSSSVLVIDGRRYEVDGEPAYWRNPFTGWAPGVQVPLKRVSG